MTYHDNRRKRLGAGPFGYNVRDLAERDPEEREKMGRELDEIETNLQWGFEPGRWAKAAKWFAEDWPEPKLLSGGDFAGMYGQRNDLTAEAADFRDVLGQANKVWKTNAGLNSPLLPSLAELPNTERERVRNQSKKFRTLVAFGVTPDRWEWEIKNLAKNGTLLNPQADSERLMGLWETRNDLIPELDATDHALDYLDELERDGGNANTPNTALNPGGDALNAAAAAVAGQVATINNPNRLVGSFGANFDPQGTDHGAGSFQYPSGGAVEVSYGESQAPDSIGPKDEDSTSQDTTTPNQTEEKPQHEPPDLYEGWPEDWEYTPDIDATPCGWAETVIANLQNDHDILVNKLVEHAEWLKNVTPEFNRVMDDYQSSIFAVGVETLLAPLQGFGGFEGAVMSMASVYSNKQEHDAAVERVMTVRRKIDRASNELNQTSKNLVMTYDKQKTLNCQ